MPEDVDTAAIIARLGEGERLAAEHLAPVVYDELRAIASRHFRAERDGHTLEPTALVHEVFIKLAGQTRVEWRGRTHFMAVAAEAMRRLLVDHARSRGTTKRGGDRRRVELPDSIADERVTDLRLDLVGLDEALDRLAHLDERQARVVTLRYFGGLTWDEIAEVVGCARSTVNLDWDAARAWLITELEKP